MSERTAPTAGKELNGWKEIATYLDVSVRTAQNFERQRGLPVHRRWVGIKAPVRAFSTELEDWRAENKRNGTPSNDGPQQTTEVETTSAVQDGLLPTQFLPVEASEVLENPASGDYRQLESLPDQSRRRWLRAALCGSAGALGAVGLGSLATKIRLDRQQPPTSYRVQGATLIVSGKNNVELWRYTFPTQMAEGIYDGAPRAWCCFADLDGDGKVETVFVYRPDGAMSNLWCFGAGGERKWVFSPGKEITDNLGRKLAPSYGVSCFEVVSSQTLGVAHIVVSSYHSWSFPNQVAVLDGRTGKKLSEYWHRGHLWHMAVADLDGDGEVEVLLGGVNDAPEHKQATLLVFDHRRISGATKTPAGGVYFQGMESGTEKYTVSFPRTPISQTEEFNRVRGVRIASDRIIVIVAEGVAEATAPGMIYELNFTLQPINAMLDSNLAGRYRELQDADKLPREAPEVIAERLMKEVTVVEGGR